MTSAPSNFSTKPVNIVKNKKTKQHKQQNRDLYQRYSPICNQAYFEAA